jgi:hypothetical protein
MPSAQVLLALLRATAHQVEPRYSACTLKPRAAAVVLMDQHRLRQLAVLAVMHCSMCLSQAEPASAVALAVTAVKQVLSLRLLAW